MQSPEPSLYVALLHHPVTNKRGEIICSAVTNLDLHDIARASKTYGVKGFFVVTPLENQKTLVKRLLDHWESGAGAKYNPDRKSALSLVRLAHDLDEVVSLIKEEYGCEPVCVATDAAKQENAISYGEMREKIQERRPHLVLFGTAWGLTPEIIGRCSLILEPIAGKGDYNHLSVRSAVSIILDRLLG